MFSSNSSKKKGFGNKNNQDNQQQSNSIMGMGGLFGAKTNQNHNMQIQNSMQTNNFGESGSNTLGSFGSQQNIGFNNQPMSFGMNGQTNNFNQQQGQGLNFGQQNGLNPQMQNLGDQQNNMDSPTMSHSFNQNQTLNLSSMQQQQNNTMMNEPKNNQLSLNQPNNLADSNQVQNLNFTNQQAVPTLNQPLMTGNFLNPQSNGNDEENKVVDTTGIPPQQWKREILSEKLKKLEQNYQKEGVSLVYNNPTEDNKVEESVDNNINEEKHFVDEVNKLGGNEAILDGSQNNDDFLTEEISIESNEEDSNDEENILIDDSEDYLNFDNATSSLNNIQTENEEQIYFEPDDDESNFIESYCKSKGYIFKTNEKDLMKFLSYQNDSIIRKLKLKEENLFYINSILAKILYSDSIMMLDDNNIEGAKKMLREICFTSIDTTISNKALDKLKDIYTEEDDEDGFKNIIGKMCDREKQLLQIIYEY